MKYSEPVVVQFQSDISLRNSSCAKFSCGGVFTPYQCARNFFSCENFSCSNYNVAVVTGVSSFSRGTPDFSLGVVT